MDKTPAELAKLAEVAMLERLSHPLIAIGPKPLHALQTDEGPVYVDVSAITLIGPPVTKPGHPEARRVAFASNVYIFILNSVENLTVLGLFDEVQVLKLREAAKPTKRRAAKPKGV